MLRALLYGLAILHLGPGIAFASLAFGCDGATPYFGVVCGTSSRSLFALLTAAGWLILTLALTALHLLRRARSSVAPRTTLRLWALLSVLAVGALVGATGAWLTGSQYWFLAIPASLATGWLFLANPLVCQPEASTTGATAANGNASSSPGTNGAA